jgi:release factor glutamine methyltransferase
MTVAAARREIAARFRQHGLDTPDLDARLIVGHVLALDHTALTAAPERAVSTAERDAIDAAAARRLAGEPVARILGVKEFWGLRFRISPVVLVPRPETETVVEAALAGTDRNAALRIADFGVGSGAILLALLTELPNAVGVGTDRDPRAAMVARGNAERLGLGARAAFVACDYGAALADRWDLLVSNPPYIPTGDIAALAPDVRLYDPSLALDGGEDGLAAYRAIAADAVRLLSPAGRLVVEIGIGQADRLPAIFAAAGLQAEPARKDLSGLPRVITATCNRSRNL